MQHQDESQKVKLGKRNQIQKRQYMIPLIQNLRTGKGNLW